MWNKEINMLKHGILGLLNYGDMTGYEIMTVFRDSLSHFWQAQTSQIYRELTVLEKKGWIVSSPVKQDGKPDKNILSITNQGKEELISWLKEDYVSAPVRSSMLMKTFFRGECSVDENIEFFKEIAEKEIVLPKGKTEVDSVSDEYKQFIEDPLKALYWKFTIEFGEMYETMVQKWCANCIKQLEDIKHEHIGD